MSQLRQVPRFISRTVRHHAGALLISAVVLGVLGGVATASALGGWYDDGSGQTRVVLRRPAPAEPSPTTLRLAFALVVQTTRSWGPGWHISMMASSAGESMTAGGEDGRQRVWVAEAVGPTGAIRWLRVTDGAVVEAIAPTTTDVQVDRGNGILDLPEIDSPDAVTRARDQRPGLSPATQSSNAKSVGVQFTYQYSRLFGRAVVTVAGEEDGLAVRVGLDAATGEVLSSEHRGYEGSTVWASGNQGTNWERRATSGVALRLATGPSGTFIATLVEGRIAASRVTPAGTEVVLGSLPADAGDWVRSMSVSGRGTLELATPTGLWSFDLQTGTATRERVDGAVTEVRSTSDGYDSALVVVSPGTPQQLWVRPPTGDWSPVAGSRADHLAEVGGRAFLFNFDTAPDGTTPKARAIAGQGNYRLAAASDGIVRSVDAGETWAKSIVLRGDIVSIATSADFPTSGFAVAAAFRGGVWATHDHGETWTEAPGPFGEPGALVVASDGTAYCIEGGQLTWIED